MDEIRKPAILDLENIDDEYFELERQHELERLEVWRRYERLYTELLDQRREILASCAGFIATTAVGSTVAAAAPGDALPPPSDAAAGPTHASPSPPWVPAPPQEPSAGVSGRSWWPRSLAGGGGASPQQLAGEEQMSGSAVQWWLPAPSLFCSPVSAPASEGAIPEGSSGARGGSSSSRATPALPGFWRLALQNAPEFQEDIERHDEPVLDYLRDVRAEWIDEANRDRGFKVKCFFEDNPYFSHRVLEKEFHTEREHKYTHRVVVCVNIVSTKIEWNPGRNVTVDVVSRRGKNAVRRRPARARKEEVPRASFFRKWFRSLGPNEEIPDEELDDSEPDGSWDLMECLVEDDFRVGVALRDHIIPHAVRWYTGEACDDNDAEGTESEEKAGDAGSEDAEEEDSDSDEDEDQDVE